MTQYPELFAALAAPFAASEVKTRPGSHGRQLHYITARTAMNRFDSVVGPENWRNRTRRESFSDGAEAIVCTIEVKVDDEWIPKEDAGGFKEMTEKTRSGETEPDEENTVKTGYSDAFKRTAILWGVGRYLYGDGVPRYTQAPASGARPHREPGEDDAPAPSAPPVSRPEPNRQAPAGQREQTHHGPPKTGRALFAWAKDQDHDGRVLRWLSKWAKLQKFPERFVDWAEDQVSTGYAAACRKLQEAAATNGTS